MSEKERLEEYKKAHPKSRVVEGVKYVKNTGCTKQRGCIYCGEKGPSWSAKWPKTKRAEKWEADHVC